MRKLLLFFLVCYTLSSCKSQNKALLPNYNSSYYPTVLEAAEGVGLPFLVQENYKTIPGVTVKNDSFLVYNGVTYAIHNHYLNPNANFDNGYYVAKDQYQAYQIPASELAVWPERKPYALYNAATTTFNSTIDCVGYGTRLLAATGSTDSTHNAYLQLKDYVHSQNVTPFAALGYVASAYEIAAAFPTLPSSVKSGWQYVAGNVWTATVDSINKQNKGHKGLKPYTGKSQGGFAKALPGDILSFGYSPGHSSNGHFMVIEEAPLLLDSVQLLSYYKGSGLTSLDLLNILRQKYNVYAVPVYDCSGKHAHFKDSRIFMSGIGHGTLLILTDKTAGIPQGFIFEAPKRNEVGTVMMSDTTIAITVGRYIPAR